MCKHKTFLLLQNANWAHAVGMGLTMFQSKKQTIIEGNAEEESGIKGDLDVLCLTGKWAMPPRVRLHKGRGKESLEYCFLHTGH